jgi:hypothetical protein
MVVKLFLNFFFITLYYHNGLKNELFLIVIYTLLFYLFLYSCLILYSKIYNKNKYMIHIDCKHMNHRHGTF